MSDARKILCVDDDPDILSFLRIVLEKEGYEVHTAESAETGISAYKETAPDLMILDLMMEEVDAGTNMVKKLRLMGNEAPIIMLSSTGDNLSMAADTSELGLSAIFQKPVDRNRLVSVIRARLC